MHKSDGWLPVINDPWRPQEKRPRDFPVIEIIRKEWDEPQKVAWEDLPLAMNVEGLYWRPARS